MGVREERSLNTTGIEKCKENGKTVIVKIRVGTRKERMRERSIG
jgi:hypothetical protein